jgi:hypothetical protein
MTEAEIKELIKNNLTITAKVGNAWVIPGDKT